MSAYPSSNNSQDTQRLRQPSPAQSSRSRRSQVENVSSQARREQNARVSFYDPQNQATLDRLLSGDVILSLDTDADGDQSGEVETESAQATLTSVEEMLERYEWASDDVLVGKAVRGTADQIEARLIDELMALEKVYIINAGA